MLSLCDQWPIITLTKSITGLRGMKATAKLLDALEDNLTTMISLVVKLKKTQAKKTRGKVLYLKMIKQVDEEPDIYPKMPLCAEEE